MLLGDVGYIPTRGGESWPIAKAEPSYLCVPQPHRVLHKGLRQSGEGRDRCAIELSGLEYRGRTGKRGRDGTADLR